MRKLAATVPRSVTALVCATLLAAGATGCGQSDQEQAREVAQDYADARSEQDYERVCELYSDSFKQELGADENCAAFVQEQTAGADVSEKVELVNVDAKDDKATAELDVAGEGGGPVRIRLILENEDGEWRITGLQ